jgi:hypothetical protein
MPLTIEELRKRNAELIAEERKAANGLTGFWYLSFASPTKFNGGVIVRAFGFVHACQRARDLQINPGGEVRGVPCPPQQVPPPKYLDRLLSRAELEECWGKMSKLSELEAEDESGQS